MIRKKVNEPVSSEEMNAIFQSEEKNSNSIHIEDKEDIFAKEFHSRKPFTLNEIQELQEEIPSMSLEEFISFLQKFSYETTKVVVNKLTKKK